MGPGWFFLIFLAVYPPEKILKMRSVWRMKLYPATSNV